MSERAADDLDDPYMQPAASTSLSWLPPDLRERVRAMRDAHQRALVMREVEARLAEPRPLPAPSHP